MYQISVIRHEVRHRDRVDEQRSPDPGDSRPHQAGGPDDGLEGAGHVPEGGGGSLGDAEDPGDGRARAGSELAPELFPGNLRACDLLIEGLLGEVYLLEDGGAVLHDVIEEDLPLLLGREGVGVEPPGLRPLLLILSELVHLDAQIVEDLRALSCAAGHDALKHVVNVRPHRPGSRAGDLHHAREIVIGDVHDHGPVGVEDDLGLGDRAGAGLLHLPDQVL